MNSGISCIVDRTHLTHLNKIFFQETTEAYVEWTTTTEMSTDDVTDADTDADASVDDIRKVFWSFCFLSVPIVTLALLSNGLAFVVFYKKPAFRKILSNK